jgi:hypothetical protein
MFRDIRRSDNLVCAGDSLPLLLFDFSSRSCLVQIARERGEQGLKCAEERLEEQVRERCQRTQDEQRFFHGFHFLSVRDF